MMVTKIEVYTRPTEVCIREKITNKLEEELDVEKIENRVWPRRVKYTDRQGRSWFEIQKYREFKEWRENKEIEIKPYFKRKTTESSVKKEEYTEIIFPVLALALYQKNELKFLFPCTWKDIDYTVGDFINSIKQGEPTEKLQRNKKITKIVEEIQPKIKTP